MIFLIFSSQIDQIVFILTELEKGLIFKSDLKKFLRQNTTLDLHLKVANDFPAKIAATLFHRHKIHLNRHFYELLKS